MTRIVGTLFIFFISISALLNGETLPFAPGLGKIAYTTSSDMRQVTKMRKKKSITEMRTVTQTIVDWVSKNRFEITLQDLSINMTGRAGGKKLLKWKYNLATKESSVDAPSEVYGSFVKATATVEVGYEELLGKTLVFERDERGTFQETTGLLKAFDKWVNEELTAFRDLAKVQSIASYRNFLSELLLFADREIQLGKQELPVGELASRAKSLKLKLSPVVYNIKKSPENGYFAYVKNSGKGRKSGADLTMKSRSKVNWDPKNALIQQWKGVVKTTAKKSGNYSNSTTKSTVSSKAI